MSRRALAVPSSKFACVAQPDLTLANLVATLVRFLALRFVIGRKTVVRA
jgi:hypothetical protein